MRIVGGEFRGRPLATPRSNSIRPTTDRTREALFNILSHRFAEKLDGARVLDLFAGTGALGLEALSRGASFCLFIEESAEGRGLIRTNVESFGLTGRSKIFRRDATELGEAGTMQPFGLLFADPPYGKGLGERGLQSARDGGWLLPGALCVVEEAAAAPFVARPGLRDRRRAQLWRDRDPHHRSCLTSASFAALDDEQFTWRGRLLPCTRLQPPVSLEHDIMNIGDAARWTRERTLRRRADHAGAFRWPDRRGGRAFGRQRHQRLHARQRHGGRRHPRPSRAGRHPHGLVQGRQRRRAARQIRHRAFLRASDVQGHDQPQARRVRRQGRRDRRQRERLHLVGLHRLSTRPCRRTRWRR